MRSPYELLGLSALATPEEVRAAYRALVRTEHPDLMGNNEAAHLRFLEIKAAYELLADPERRAAYDRAPDAVLEALDRTLAERREQLARRRRRLRRLYE